MSLAFLDTNIPLYVLGESHPLKDPSIEILELASEKPSNFVTDAEVLQEILHRYISRKRLAPGMRGLQFFMELMEGRIEGITADDVRHAASLAPSHPSLQARDLVHLAVAIRLNIPYVISADKAFDRTREIERLDPANVASWKQRVIN